MTIVVKPELEAFIAEQVKSGRFDSADAAVNAAVAKFQAEEELLAGEIDDGDLAAIEEGLAQLNRGEGRPWEEIRTELRAKYLAK